MKALPVALVTGGGRGIGRATAVRLARAGYDVCINCRGDIDAARETLAMIEAAGCSGWVVTADVSDEAAVLSMFAGIDARGGPLGALVNNAGVLFAQSTLTEMSAARMQRVFAVNVIGSLLCAREAVRRMSTRRGGGGGVVINVSSAAARLGSPDEYIDYAASKGAIDTFTLGLAKEEGPYGIRVNAVRPGLIETTIHADGGEPERVARLAPDVPMRRGGSAEEVAATIAWLISDEASYVNGALLDVTGGR